MGEEPPLDVRYRRSQLAALEARCGPFGIVDRVKQWLTGEVAYYAAQHPRHPLDESVALEDVLPRLMERFLGPNLAAKKRLAPRESFAEEIRDFVEHLRTRRPPRELRFVSRQFAPFDQDWRPTSVQVSILYEIDRARYQLVVRLLVDPPANPPQDHARGGR